MYWVDRSKTPIPESFIEGTLGSEFVEEIKFHPGDIVLKKVRNSAFIGTPLYLLLKNNGIKTLVLTGCQTDGCVEFPPRDAAYSYNYLCILVEDCIASFNVEMHETMMWCSRKTSSRCGTPESKLILCFRYSLYG